ncbi:MAG TPA: CapA family protein [Jatrophihabitans sp.]|nr:CapA family protein [Jatrophihabitans sp.]
MRRGRLAVPIIVIVLLAGCTSQQPAAPGRSAAGSPSPAGVQTVMLPADTGKTGTAARAPAVPAGRTATVLGSGDVLIHPPLWQQAHADARAEGRSGYDFGPMYASIAPDVRTADLATCEMETPLAPPQGPFVGWPQFSAPPQVLTALKAVGYDTCTTASNHSLDQGYRGVKRTLDELDAAGLRHTGSARTEQEAHTPLIVTLRNGVRIGQLAYSFDFNGIALPAGKPWLANRIDVPRILAAAKRLKAAGADIVVLSMHWGVEYDHLATDEQRAQARALLASPDIDLILGDHAHVVQPAQRIHGKWVFYCMGNQISRHADPIPAGREGIMPIVTFREVAPHRFQVASAAAIPTWMADSPALRLIDLPRALAAPGLTPAQRREYTRAHQQIAGYLDAYGAQSPRPDDPVGAVDLVFP